jgi:hypothetical protein
VRNLFLGEIPPFPMHPGEIPWTSGHDPGKRLLPPTAYSLTPSPPKAFPAYSSTITFRPSILTFPSAINRIAFG